MQIRLNRVTTFILLVPLYPLVLLLRLSARAAGHRKPVYTGTLDGDPLRYAGEKPVLIAVWSESASLWAAATADVVKQLRAEFAGRCEFAYVAEGPESVSKYGWVVVPTIVLRHRGGEVGRFANTIEVDEIRAAVEATLAEPRAAADRGPGSEL